MRMQFKVLPYVMALFILLLAACQSQTVEVTRTVTEEVEVTRVVTEEVPADAGKLIIYSGRSESLVQPINDQFKAATGIEVEERNGSTSEMEGVLLEEGEN